MAGATNWVILHCGTCRLPHDCQLLCRACCRPTALRRFRIIVCFGEVFNVSCMCLNGRDHTSSRNKMSILTIPRSWRRTGLDGDWERSTAILRRPSPRDGRNHRLRVRCASGARGCCGDGEVSVSRGFATNSPRMPKFFFEKDPWSLGHAETETVLHREFLGRLPSRNFGW